MKLAKLIFSMYVAESSLTYHETGTFSKNFQLKMNALLIKRTSHWIVVFKPWSDKRLQNNFIPKFCWQSQNQTKHWTYFISSKSSKSWWKRFLVKNYLKVIVLFNLSWVHKIYTLTSYSFGSTMVIEIFHHWLRRSSNNHLVIQS